MSKRPHGHFSRGGSPPDHDRRPGQRWAGDRRSGSERPGPASTDEKDADDGPILIFGVHAADAALRNPRRGIQKLFVTDNGENRLKDAIATRKQVDAIGIARVTPRDLDRRLGADTVHQGVLLECDPLPEPTLADLAELPDTSGPLVVLDQVTDPHNVGAILRSAAVFGAQGLVMTRRHSPPLGGVLAKSASGALEHVPVALVPNLARALIELGGLAYRRIGLDGTGNVDVVDEPFRGRVAIVMGAEGRGLRQLTREHCDVLARIAGSGPLGSLNVSNAAAVTLHLAAMRRRAAASAG